MSGAYYNEFDSFNVAWLRQLMAKNMIAPGEIDGRDIRAVVAADLRGFAQCHFFAGTGVWSHALRIAGWPDEERVWTGSCPCQPFSVSGKRTRASDERHLWPEFFRLIEIEKPVTVFGEQVASDDGLAWLDLVSSDLEGQGYTVGAVDTPACGFGAPHMRQRLYWVAHSEHGGIVGESSLTRLERLAGNEHDGNESRRLETESLRSTAKAGFTRGFWADAEWLWCRDEKYRPIEPGTLPLAHGVANRVGKLRGYGNALVAPQAQAFIKAYMQIEVME